MLETAEKVGRDVRVDSIGFVGELKRQVENDLRTKLKVRMDTDALDRVRGDYFEGLLVSASSTEIDAEQWVALWQARKITREQFVAAISVGKTEAKKALGDDHVARISVTKPPTMKLNVERIEGVEPVLMDAIFRLTAEARDRDAAAAAAPAKRLRK